MSSTKVSRIIATIKTRLEGALIANGYATDIGQAVQSWPVVQFSGVTHCAVFLRERAARASAEVRHICEAELEVEAHHSTDPNGDRAKLAGDLLGDIQKAVETDQADGLEALLKGAAAPVWVGDSVDYSDAAGSYVSVRVIYSVPHVRRRADPEIA